jgi:hypothetical protein
MLQRSDISLSRTLTATANSAHLDFFVVPRTAAESHHVVTSRLPLTVRPLPYKSSPYFVRQIQAPFFPLSFMLSIPSFIHSLVVFLLSFTVTSFTQEVFPSPPHAPLKPSLVFCFDRLLTGPPFFLSPFASFLPSFLLLFS